MSGEALNIIEQISREKGIDRDILVDALKSAVEVAARKRLPEVKELHGVFNEDTGVVDIYVEKTVVETIEDPSSEITLEDARQMVPEVEMGETIHILQELENYGRIAAQLAKQVILQKVREAEIDLIYQEFKDKKGELINGIVQRFEHGDLIVDLGKAEGILPRREQVFRETFNRGERIRAYILDVRKTSRNAMVILSRTHVGLIKNLFEMEVPEISEGMVEIMGIVREPNGRTKIAVRTNDRDIDAVGACVGMRGMRVQAIVQELRGEKIDIVEYSEDPQVFIRNALSPAKITRIIPNENERHMTIIVADDQMSLAIGKKGQNVRLAAKLVKWKIDIQGESESSAVLGQAGWPGKKAVPQIDLMSEVNTAKGLGEKVAAILFANNVETCQDVVDKGINGLTQFTGIGPKKAEAILALAEELIAQAELSPPEETPVAVEEEPAGEVSEMTGEPETKPEFEEAAVEAETTETAEEESEDLEEEQEILIDELVGVDSEIIKILKENGFQTLAELSITPAEDLWGIQGVDEEAARKIIDQAKQRMENIEST